MYCFVTVIQYLMILFWFETVFFYCCKWYTGWRYNSVCVYLYAYIYICIYIWEGKAATVNNANWDDYFVGREPARVQNSSWSTWFLNHRGASQWHHFSTVQWPMLGHKSRHRYNNNRSVTWNGSFGHDSGIYSGFVTEARFCSRIVPVQLY